MTTATAPAPAAEWPRPVLLFRHEDLFWEPAYPDWQPCSSSDENDDEVLGG